ncbi:DUF2333 family protein [Marinimicrobium sp. C6131]|uniref:DUF2333 family protein n=1 Tax=Marinimicrobium sp. C6131 TaxID=3022676 RepID=UPI00223D1AC3|nr:DUF2333 family protein [Marinimicrobium sp. C6131]UZJ44864.1 DUF2333 family protein [Marinimicrobium sp. C6131]
MPMSKAKQFWIHLQRKLRDTFADTRDDVSRLGVRVKIGLAVLGLYVLLALVVGIYWSMTPGFFTVEEYVTAQVEERGGKRERGAVMTSTLIGVAETLLEKPGGYLTNDITPPGLWLDNMPSWEYGVVIQVRDASKAMREAFSRSQSQSREDQDLALAESRFNFNTDSWIMPATERQYREGIQYTRRYLDRLTGISDQNAEFYTRADNLRYWLSTVETRLGSLSQRLSASVGQRRLNTDLPLRMGEPREVAPGEVIVKTPWTELDNVYYEARGSAWALIHLLKAAEIEFADVLDDKNARVSLGQIIRELEATQRSLMSPMILNGSGFGLLANHSLVMASYISRANAALIDLRSLLDRG